MAARMGFCTGCAYGAALFLGLFASAEWALAQQSLAPVPSATIYPGDIIQDNALTDGPDISRIDPEYVTSRAMIVGRLARRTLLAGRPVPLSALEDPRSIAHGASVQLVYQQPGLSITANGMALQAARIGDSIRVRNTESGLIVTGVVSNAGIVRVSQ